MRDAVWIGSGAGFAGDRFDAAIPVVDTLIQHPGPRYLIYEVLAERTLAIGQRLKSEDPAQGFSPWLHRYLPAVLPRCLQHGVTIVANFGNANPVAAAQQIHALAAELGCTPADGLRVAVVQGDDLLEFMPPMEILRLPCIEGTRFGRNSNDLASLASADLLGANAYLGAQPIARALALSPQIVIVGRSTDAALVLGPLIHEFGWQSDQLDLLAAGTLAGHLLECGAQVTGGYFADPGFKEVPGLDRVGFPVAEISPDGRFELTKARGTGGLVTRATVIEQMLYEVHDPACYLTPDVTLDITDVSIDRVGPDRMRLVGAKGHPPPTTLKATVSLEGGWLGEAEISYAGPNALARAKLAAEVVRSRLQGHATEAPTRVEIIGTGAVHASDHGSVPGSVPTGELSSTLLPDTEYRVRVATRSRDAATAQQIIDEVLALYCCGPAAGGGVRQTLSAQVSTASILLPRDAIEAQVSVRLVPAASRNESTGS